MAKPLEIEGKTRKRVFVTHAVDPTGVTIEFGITAADSHTQPTTWVAGTWEGTWNSVTGVVKAFTPSIGSAGDLVVAADTEYQVWARFTVDADDSPVVRCGTFPTA